MLSNLRKAVAPAFAGASMLLCSLHSAAATIPVISGTIDGRIFSCSDPTDNQDVNITFTFGGGEVGADTNISFTIVYAGTQQTIVVPIPTSDVLAFADAIASTTNVTTSIPPTDVGFGCLFEATLTFTSIGSIDRVIPEAIPGNVLTTGPELDAFLRGQPSANSRRIRNVLKGRGNGVQRSSSNGFIVSGMSAAQGSAPPLGAWFGYSFSDTENDFASTAFEAKRHGVLFGIDTMPGDNWLVGVSVGLERSSIDTRFNNGEQDITAIALAPYFGMLFNDWLSFDISGGISTVSNDQFRRQGAARITSDVDSVRVFANANLAASHDFGALRVTGQTGVLWATQRDDDFVESNGQRVPESSTNLGRILLGGELAYAAGAWEPYVSGLFEHDFTRSRVQFAPGVAVPKNDDSDVLLAVGLRYFGNRGVSGGVEYSKLLGRRNLDEDSINANLRWQF